MVISSHVLAVGKKHKECWKQWSTQLQELQMHLIGKKW